MSVAINTNLLEEYITIHEVTLIVTNFYFIKMSILILNSVFYFFKESFSESENENLKSVLRRKKLSLMIKLMAVKTINLKHIRKQIARNQVVPTH